MKTSSKTANSHCNLFDKLKRQNKTNKINIKSKNRRKYAKRTVRAREN